MSRYLCVCVLLCALWPSQAVAQPNPFEAYERQRGDAVTGLPVASAPQLAQDQTLLRGPLAIGASGSFSAMAAEDTRSDGKKLESSTVLMRLTGLASYRLTPSWEVQVLPGFMVRDVSVQDSSGVSVLSGVLEARGLYHVPLTPRLRLLPALGLGLHVGSGSLDVQIGDKVVSEETDSWGGLFTGEVALGYDLSPQFELRLGLSGSVIVGREKSDLTGLSTTSWTSLAGMQLGFLVWF